MMDSPRPAYNIILDVKLKLSKQNLRRTRRTISYTIIFCPLILEPLQYQNLSFVIVCVKSCVLDFYLCYYTVKMLEQCRNDVNSDILCQLGLELTLAVPFSLDG